MEQKKSQTHPKQHSEAKTFFLRSYFGKYSSILNQANFVTTIEIYDLFCGPGVYENNIMGSPIILLNLIKEYFLEKGNLNTNFKFHFNDLNIQKLNKLKENVKQLGLLENNRIQVAFHNLDFVKFIDNIVFSNKSSKRIYFIDPYGYKEFSKSNLNTILRDKNSEILFFVPLDFMYRFKFNPPNVLKKLFEELSSEEDIKEISTAFSQFDFNQLLLSMLRKEFKNCYIDSFMLQRNNNKYFSMFFFTFNILGLEKFVETKWELDKISGIKWENNVETFFKDIQYLEKLKTGLLIFLKHSQSNIDIYEFALKNGYLPKHVKFCLKEFENKGRILISELKDFKRKNKGYYINYDDYKNNNLKLSFKLI